MSQFTPEQRVKIYEEALEIYSRLRSFGSYCLKDPVTGRIYDVWLCPFLTKVLYTLGYTPYDSESSYALSQDLPEFAAQKPDGVHDEDSWFPLFPHSVALSSRRRVLSTCIESCKKILTVKE